MSRCAVTYRLLSGDQTPRRTIRESWEQFAAMVIPADAPAVQRTEMRKAFWAGAASSLLLVESVGWLDCSVEEGAQYIHDRLEEALKELGGSAFAQRMIQHVQGKP